MSFRLNPILFGFFCLFIVSTSTLANSLDGSDFFSLSSSSLAAISSSFFPSISSPSSSSSSSSFGELIASNTTLIYARYLARGIAVGPYLLFAGGLDSEGAPSSIVQIYMAAKQAWWGAVSRGGPPLGLATIGDVAVFATAYSSVLYAYNVSDLTWTPITVPFHERYTMVQVGGIQNFIVCVPGSSPYSYIYDYSLGTWKTIELRWMMDNPYAHPVVQAKSLLFFCSDQLASCLVFDYRSSNWTSLALPSIVYLPAIAAIGDLVIFAGGAPDPLAVFGLYDTVNIYNVTSGVWTNATLSQARKGAATAIVRDCVIIAGGVADRGARSAAVDVFNLTSNSWYRFPTHLSEGRSDIAAASAGIAGFGGGLGRTVYVSDALDLFAFHCSNHSDCDDGIWCNGQEQCSNFSECVNGLPPCSLYNACNNTCNEERRDCFTSLGTSCSKGSFCDTVNVCDGAGICQQGVKCDQECHTTCDDDAKECAPTPGAACGWYNAGKCEDDGTCQQNGGILFGILAGSILGAGLLFGTCACFLVRWRRKVREAAAQELKVPPMLQLTDIVVQERLGGGQFGEVYRGMWLGSAQVALKKLKSPEQARAFFREANTLLSLNHPHVVRFLGIYSATSSELEALSSPSSLSSSDVSPFPSTPRRPPVARSHVR